jgi:DNA (cytosine-5)-methyltransferase 1
LEGFGYTNFAKVLNAKDYGVTQNRERIFMVSILGNASYHFPRPVELTGKVADILEDNVPEYYYVDDEKVWKMIEHCDRKQLEGCGFKFEPTDGGYEW